MHILYISNVLKWCVFGRVNVTLVIRSGQIICRYYVFCVLQVFRYFSEI